MDAADIIDSFATGPYTVTRRTNTGFTGQGRAIAPGSSTLSIAASMQAATGRDLLRLPEGRRAIETRVVFTATELLVAEQGGANDADLVAIDGRSFEVQMVERWPQAVADQVYYRCIVQLVAP